MKKTFTYLISFFVFVSCTEEIEIEIPPTEQQYVVEGIIEQDKAPLVFLSKSHNYFDPYLIDDIDSYIIKNATVEVIANGQTYTLFLDSNFLSFPPYFYTCEPSYLSGELNTTYKLNIYVDTVTLTSKTTIPNENPPDSVWFEFEEGRDSLGYIKFYYTDPDTIGNCFRILSKINNIIKYFTF